MAITKNSFIRFIFSILVIIISLKQFQESQSLVTSAQDNIKRAKHILYLLKIDNLGYLYNICPRLILIMNYSLLTAAVLYLINQDGYILLINIFMIIQLLFINNIILDNSSKCYLIASTYLSIYGSFYYLK